MGAGNPQAGRCTGANRATRKTYHTMQPAQGPLAHDFPENALDSTAAVA